NAHHACGPRSIAGPRRTHSRSPQAAVSTHTGSAAEDAGGVARSSSSPRSRIGISEVVSNFRKSDHQPKSKQKGDRNHGPFFNSHRTHNGPRSDSFTVGVRGHFHLAARPGTLV